MAPVQGEVILLAAGRSERMGGPRNKVLLPLAGRSILSHVLTTLAACPSVAAVVVVTRPEERESIASHLVSFPKPWRWAPGGPKRQDSVYQGLQRVSPDSPLVAVHDAARPLASCDLFCRVLAAAAQRGAAIPACPATDTIKEVEADGRVVRTLERARLRQVQTPQAFRRTWLEEAHRRARAEGFYGTDDASLVERLGRPVFVLPGEPWNGKITHPEDLVWAEAWCLRRQGMEFPLIEQRVGYGYDIHPFAPHRPLWLGGVRLADSGGLKGHSDADVVLHALCDALLGAAALGDLGHHFPPTDPAYRDISSRLLLEQTWAKVRAQGWHLSNADVMVLAERPRLAPFIPAMRRAIAEVLGCEEERISIKATTHEGLDAVGEGKGIAAHAVVHLWRTAAASERN